MPNQAASANPSLQEVSIPPISASEDRMGESGNKIDRTPVLRNNPRKKIWIDLDNSPHVPFFLPIIEELRKRGLDIVLTARDTYQVCELLEFFNLPCKVIGRHYGTNKALKVLGNCLRAAQLAPTTAKMHGHLALSHGSRAQILVCKALRITTIMMHDYEFSTKTGFVKPDWVFTPDVIPDNVMISGSERILKYPGLKEDVYVPRFLPDPSLLTTLGVSRDEFVVTVRPPATEAHYHNPEGDLLFAETLRFLCESPRVRVVVLPRSTTQGAQIRRDWFHLIIAGKVIIPAAPVDGLNLIWFSDLVISGGGTMNREAAALGVPVYSIFRGKIGAVDRYLAETGRLALLESVRDIRSRIDLKRWDRPEKPGNAHRPTLQYIVNNIVAISEGKCPSTQQHA